jgi:hypothetical protein
MTISRGVPKFGAHRGKSAICGHAANFGTPQAESDHSGVDRGRTWTSELFGLAAVAILAGCGHHRGGAISSKRPRLAALTVGQVRAAFAAEQLSLRRTPDQGAGAPLILIPDNPQSPLYSVVVYDARSVSGPLGLRVANAGEVFVRVRNIIVTYPAASSVTAQVQSAVFRLRRIGSRANRGVITSEFVVQYFERHSGQMLSPISNPGIPGFSPPSEILQPSDEAKRRYGDFRIDVFRDRGAAVAESVSSNQRSDRNGVHWAVIAAEHPGDRTVWLAAKVYGNVALYWWNAKKQLDRRWFALDKILSAVLRMRRR